MPVTVSMMRFMNELDRLIVVVTTGKIMTMEELANVQGRAWEDVDVSAIARIQKAMADKPYSTD